jgi:hypothetical protein
MSRATDAAFDELHALLVDGMTDELRENIRRSKLPKCDEEYEPLNTRLLATIRATLKDNGIDTPAASRRFDGLTQQLRDLDLDDARPN